MIGSEDLNGLFVWMFVYQLLVGGFNPSEKYARQIGSFPIGRGEHQKCLKPPPRLV